MSTAKTGQDRERCLAVISPVVMDGTISLAGPFSMRVAIREEMGNKLADAMLEFAANCVETVEGDQVYRAEELRAQISDRSGK